MQNFGGLASKIGSIPITSWENKGRKISLISIYIIMEPKEIFNQFLGDLSSNQIEKAYDGTAEEFKSIATPSEFEKFYSESEVLRNVKEVSLEEKSVTENNTELSGMAITQNGKQYPISVSFEKEDGSWKISAIDIKPIS